MENIAGPSGHELIQLTEVERIAEESVARHKRDWNGYDGKCFSLEAPESCPKWSCIIRIYTNKNQYTTLQLIQTPPTKNGVTAKPDRMMLSMTHIDNLMKILPRIKIFHELYEKVNQRSAVVPNNEFATVTFDKVASSFTSPKKVVTVGHPNVYIDQGLSRPPKQGKKRVVVQNDHEMGVEKISVGQGVDPYKRRKTGGGKDIRMLREGGIGGGASRIPEVHGQVEELNSEEESEEEEEEEVEEQWTKRI